MKRFYLAALMLLAGCAHRIKTSVATPAINATTALGTANSTLLDKASGYGVGALKVAGTLPETGAKRAITEVLTDQQYLLGAPTATTRATFETFALNLASDDTGVEAKAEAQRVIISGQVEALKNQIQSLKDAQTKALNDITAQYKLQIEQAQQKTRDLISYIFFGTAALCMLGAIAVAVLASSYPLFGPKAAVALALGGLTSAATGVGILKLMSISGVYLGIGAVVILVIVACVLIGANHNHASSNVSVTPGK